MGESKSDLSRMVRAKVVAYSQPLDLALLRVDGVTEALPVVGVSESGRARIWIEWWPSVIRNKVDCGH
jgi:serine protease Do